MYELSMTIRVPRPAIPHLYGGTRCFVAAHPELPDTTVAIDWSRFPAK